MKIPQDVAEKVRQYIKSDKKDENSFCDVCEWIEDNTDTDSASIKDLFITDKPTGSKQNVDEYCEQHTGYEIDDYYGKYYHQIEGSNEYVGFNYEC